MKALSADPVPNIRFNYAKTAQIVKARLSNSNLMDCQDTLKKMEQSDSDFDVKFYSAKTLSESFSNNK